MTIERTRRPLLVLFMLLFLPSAGFAQSQIFGVVRDESAAVLPGVTVEATSPVLIEKVRTAVTDAQGRYTIIDLRPGIYRLSFSLSGFSTTIREGIDLPSDFAATINIDMKVGALEETITVTGQTPLVDVRQATRTQVMSREILDTLPSARTLQTVGASIPGIRISTPDVGGTRMTLNTDQQAHGMGNRNNSSQLDGMQVQSPQGDGGNLGWLNDTMNAEVSVTTFGIPADTSGGGIRINSIPRDGGNQFSGSAFLGGTKGSWQSDNLDPSELQGVVVAQSVTSLQNFNASMGGPIVRSKLWFYVSPRHLGTDLNVINGVHADGSPVIEDQYVRNASLRLTYQASQKNKIGATLDRIWKQRGTINPEGTDPKAASTRTPVHGLYIIGQAKWTSTVSNRWLAEGGYSTYFERWRETPKPERFFERGTPEWYANARRQNNVLIKVPDCELPLGCNVWGSSGQDVRTEGVRKVISSSVSYVTGSHNLKTGFQWSFGSSHPTADRQADLIQIYRNGAPNQVTISNTPTIIYTDVNYDLGVYIQDSWTFKRLTISPGIRFESFNSESGEVSMSAGRFVPARFYPRQKDLPNWRNDPAPRMSIAYDLFGNGRTALKGTISRYHEAWASGFAGRYSPVSSNGTSTFNWRDLNGDDIAQEAEFINNPGSNIRFGQPIVTRAPDPDIRRAYNMEYALQLQHQLMPNMSINIGYFRRIWKNMEASDNTLTTREDWTTKGVAFKVPNPLVPGQLLNAYELNPSVRGQVFTLDFSDKALQSRYDDLEVSWNARFVNGSTLFGGWTMERNITVDCGVADDPNALGTSRFLAYPVARGLQTGPDGTPWCDQGATGMPWVHELKLSGMLPVRYGIEVAGTLQNQAGQEYAYTYALQNTDFPGGTNVGTGQNLLLSQPGTQYYPRYVQLDLSFRKNFRSGRKTFSPSIDVFNVTNSNSILTKKTAVSLTNTGQVDPTLNDVTSFLTGRLVRLTFQMKF